MCDPVSIAVGLTIASGVSEYAGQQAAAEAQEEANDRGRELALQNRNLQIRTLQNAEDEESRRASEALMDNSKAAEAARATAQVSAGESGVSGLSIDALLGDLERQEDQNKNDILQTQDFGQRQRQLDREGLGITAQSQINQMPLVQYPSFFETALKTGGKAYGASQS